MTPERIFMPMLLRRSLQNGVFRPQTMPSGRELGQHALADHQATFTRSLAQGRLGAVRPLRIVGDDIEQDGGVNGRDHRARD